ncbi:EamA family transporter [Micromonospora sp. DT4]|uniref:EamA family transporter n=1 Tax=Micromonospora sp. DT4 TaxID=3393438 RepID=UPI003CF9667D
MSSSPPSAAAASGRRAFAAPTLVWTALVVVYLLWGSTYLAIRITVETLPSLLSAALRFAVAGLVLAVVLRLRRGPGTLRVGRHQLGSAALVGVLLLAGGNGLVVPAESGPPGVALPAVAVALGALLVAEPITPQVLLGGAVIVAGVALVVSTERPRRRRAEPRSGAARAGARR